MAGMDDMGWYRVMGEGMDWIEVWYVINLDGFSVRDLCG